jgi:hypothetical protein
MGISSTAMTGTTWWRWSTGTGTWMFLLIGHDRPGCGRRPTAQVVDRPGWTTGLMLRES